MSSIVQRPYKTHFKSPRVRNLERFKEQLKKTRNDVVLQRRGGLSQMEKDILLSEWKDLMKDFENKANDDYEFCLNNIDDLLSVQNTSRYEHELEEMERMEEMIIMDESETMECMQLKEDLEWQELENVEVEMEDEQA